MKIVSFVFSLLLITGVLLAEDSTEYPGVKGSDEEIAAKLKGTWTGKEKGFRATLVYKANGVCTSDLIPEDLLVKMVADPYNFTGKWEIKNGVLLTTVVTSNTKAIPVGAHYKDQPQLLNAETFVTKNEKGMVTTFKKAH